MQKLVVLCC